MKRIPIEKIDVGTHRRALKDVKALAASIQDVGLLNPITVRKDGDGYRLVAGYHRLEACKALDWLEIEATVVDLNDLEAELAEIDENLCRHDLNVQERALLNDKKLDILLALHPETHTEAHRPKADNWLTVSQLRKQIASESGQSEGSVKRDLQIARNIAPDVHEALRDTPVADSTTDLLTIARQPVEVQREIAVKVAAGGTVDAAIKAVRSKARSGRVDVARTHAAENADPESDIIIIGNFIEVCDSIPDDSVDFIFTDPPYDDGSVPLYGDLARIAARILKPGGSLITYVGHHAMPNVLNLMTPHLRFWWTLAVHHNGNTARLPGKWVYVHWKPMLWFVKGGRRDNEFVADYVESKPTDKALHDWQQDTTEAAYYIEHLTMPGDTVLDPFCGSGTTIIAALSIGRKAIGIEVDAERASVAKGRINGFTSGA